MRITPAFVILLATSQFLLTACKKAPIAIPKETPAIVVPVIVPEKPQVVTPPTYNRIINLGGASETLLIDGATLDLQCNDLIVIKGGKYKSIDIKNIVSADGCPITIKNDGLVEVVGDFNQMALTNLKNVTISGDGTKGLDKGFLFRDNRYRAVQIQGTLNKFTFQYVAFKNIGDMNIAYIYRTEYTGGDDSYSKDLKFLNISCDNTQQLFGSNGSVDGGTIKGLIRNIEIAYVDFKNSPSVGAVVYLGNADNYDIHHNKIDNINTAINNHNGIFSVSGNGQFHDNYISNHQGNAIRAWGYSIGTTPKTIYIYNNIVLNSRKYSGFEVQAFDFSMIAGKTTFSNAVIFNNTCGNINTSNDWQGNVVDVYSLKGGKCEVYNNLGFNFPTTGSTIAGQQAELVPIVSNNIYFKTSTEAGIVDQTSVRLNSNSPAKFAGKATPILIKDYYDSPRNTSNPSIGAVE